MKHTQGKWTAESSSFGENIRVENLTIATCYRRAGNEHEAEANAKLIAAAPELLEACQSMIKAFMDAPNEWLMTADVMQMESIMKDAINKATT